METVAPETAASASTVPGANGLSSAGMSRSLTDRMSVAIREMSGHGKTFGLLWNKVCGDPICHGKKRRLDTRSAPINFARSAIDFDDLQAFFSSQFRYERLAPTGK